MSLADLFPSRPAAPGRLVDVAGLRWHLEEDGAQAPGLPLLLLHGYLAAAHVWRPLRAAIADAAAAGGDWRRIHSVARGGGPTAPLISTPRRVLAVDLPGCGYSDRPGDAPYDLVWLRERTLALLDALHLDHVVVVGHSLGGGLALHLAAAAPERVAGLALLAPLCFATPLPRILAPAARRPGLFQIFFRTLGRPLIVPAMLGNYGFSRGRRAPPRVVGAGPATLHPASGGGLTAGEARAMARLSLAHLDAAGGWDAATRMGVAAAFRDDMTPLLGHVKAPTLIVHGDRDRVHPSALGHRLVAALPQARSLVVEDCGHNPHLEQPTWLAQQLAELVDAVAGVAR